MPLLADVLGDDVVANLARTAGLLAADNAVLDALAEREWRACVDAEGLSVPEVARMPAAVRTRVLRLFALNAGTSGGALSHRHIEALDALVVDWHGQGPVALPGGIEVIRRSEHLVTPRDVL